mgnify:CR=1 FL=1
MAGKPYTIQAAKSQLSWLVARAEQGEEVVIARGRRPVARLVALDAPRAKREFGEMRGRARVTRMFFDALLPDELAAWDE